jgi:two-component system sensor histidine kinase UhpB
MLAQFHNSVPLWTAIGWFVTNCSEALIGALFITRFIDPKTAIESVRGVFTFVTFGVLIAPFLTSFLDAASVVITGWGRGYWSLGMERFWSNALAVLTIVPIVVIGTTKGRSWIRRLTVARLNESALLVIATLLVALLVFGSKGMSPSSTPALLYLPLPLLLWAAARFGLVGVSLSVLATSLISIWYTVHGRQPFPYASTAENIVSLQVLFCTVVIPLMFLSAVIAEAQRTRESLQHVSGSLIRAQEEERHRIARDLHDDLGQRLALVNVQIKCLIGEADVSMQPSLTELSNQLSAISDTAHSISHDLYPSQLEYLGLVPAVKKLCSETQSARALSLQLKLGNVPGQLQSSVSLCMYRVLQETLHNIITHSEAKNVEVELTSNDREILLRVVDDGVGFDLTHEAEGIGLKSICQRVQSQGGSIDIVSTPNRGTRIEVRTPLKTEDVAGAA